MQTLIAILNIWIKFKTVSVIFKILYFFKNLATQNQKNKNLNLKMFKIKTRLSEFFIFILFQNSAFGLYYHENEGKKIRLFSLKDLKLVMKFTFV